MKEPVTNLLQKYVNGTITDAESIDLFAYLKLHAPEEDPVVKALLLEVYQASFAEPPQLSADAGQRILDKLLRSVTSKTSHAVLKENAQQQAYIPETNKVHSLRRTWIRYAAAAAVLIAVSVYLYTNKKEHGSHSTALAQYEVPPGYNHALLQMSNGKQVVLDSTQGTVVSNDQLMVRNSDGKLNYEARAALAEYHTLSTPRGGQYRLQLPDGTEVWLNAASRITYPTTFAGSKNRKVTVSGEAYFEVTKNKQQPFIVDIDGKAEVEVLGTHFDINAYNDEYDVLTTLLEGSIRMKAGKETALLKPGRQAQLSRQKLWINESPDIEMVMAWKNGSFRFLNTHIVDVLKQLSRWYDVDIVYKQGIPNLTISGEIKRDLNLSQALFVLEKMGLQAHIEGKQLLVQP